MGLEVLRIFGGSWAWSGIRSKKIVDWKILDEGGKIKILAASYILIKSLD
jgi:hypothetical protein